MPDDTFYIKQNDTSPKLEAFCEKINGEPQNLTGATLEFHMMVKPAGTTKISAGSAAIVNVSTGEWSYAFSASDTNTADEYEAEVEVTFSDGSILTFPNDGNLTVVITDDVA